MFIDCVNLLAYNGILMMMLYDALNDLFWISVFSSRLLMSKGDVASRQECLMICISIFVGNFFFLVLLGVFFFMSVLLNVGGERAMNEFFCRLKKK